MEDFRLERKTGFRIVGYRKELGGTGTVHEPSYSAQKTEFFKGLLKEGRLDPLRPLAESPLGIAAVVPDGGTVFYYGGVVTSRQSPEQTEEALFPDGDYLIFAGSGGLSRLAFDRLEDQAFHRVLRDHEEWEYAGTPVAEVLLNGNPADAEVEVWIPVVRRSR